MKKTIKSLVKIGSAAMALVAMLSTMLGGVAFAADIPGCARDATGKYVTLMSTENSNVACTDFSILTVISTGINFLLIVIGTLSVVMIIVGGIRYTASGGNDKSVASAKNTIMYAVIGLVVAALAGAIVNFVLKDALNIQ